jgi:hypothetical protein
VALSFAGRCPHALAGDVNELPDYIRAVETPSIYSDRFHAHEMGMISRPGSVPVDAVVPGHGSQVYDVNGEHIGHLDEIVHGERGVASAFVVDTSTLFGRESVIPVSRIASITHGRIVLNVGAGQLKQTRVA